MREHPRLQVIFDGTHPQYGHSPRTSLASTPGHVRARFSQLPGGVSPPGPIPITTMSVSSMLMCFSSPLCYFPDEALRRCSVSSRAICL